MKVLQYCSKFPPLAGGAGTHAYNLGKELVREGHRVVVICEHAPGLSKYEKVSDNHYVHRVKVPFINDRGSGIYFGLLCWLIALKGLLLIAKEKPNLLHFMDAATGIAGQITRFFVKKIPTVQKIGGSMTYEYLCNNADKYHWDAALGENYAWEHATGFPRLLFNIEKKFYTKNDRVYTSADYQVDMLKSHFNVDFPKVRSLYNGLDTTVIQKENFDDIKDQSEYKKFLYSGSRLVKYKGLHNLIEACKPILEKHDTYLLIGGDGPEEDYLKNMASAHPFIKFLGNLSWEENIKYVRSADIFVLPTLVDKIPNALIEALTLETPCLTSNIDGVKEMVPDGCGILIEPNNVEILREKIEWMLTHPQESIKMGKNARDFMIKEFDWKITYSRVKSVYSELLTGIEL